MNTIQKLLVGLMFAVIVIGSGCKDDDDDPVGCANWADDVTAEATAFTNAGEAWALDPTPAKCQAYKDAGQNYVDELNAHVDCATLSGHQAELQAVIDSIQTSVNNIQC